MFSYATPNNILALGFDCLLHSQPIILDFWYGFIVSYSYLLIYLDYFYLKKYTHRS
jgi:hypothetical protein